MADGQVRLRSHPRASSRSPFGSPAVTSARPPIRFPIVVLLLLVVLVAVMTVAVAVGSVQLSAADVWAAVLTPDADPSTRNIVLKLRLPRVLLAVVVGAGLGAAGAAYQAIFRNPLADPFVIGSASGGSVGVVVVLVTGWAGVSGTIGPTATGAFVGSVLAVLLVFLIAGAGRGQAESLLLAGATVSALCAAVVWLLSTFFQSSLPKLMGWVTGGLSLNPDNWNSLTVAGPLILVGGVVLSLLGRPLDALRAGDDTARALGLPVGAVLLVVLAAACLATAATVAVGGVIGFIGLVAPHLARPLAGAAHARLVPMSALVGAVLLVPADLLARSAAPPHELPLGAITALAGGPVFLVVLRTTARRRVVT